MNRPLALALCGTTACGITETGNPEFEVSMAMLARSSDTERVTVGGDAPTVVDSVWVNLEDLRFVTGEVCDAPGEVEHDLPDPGVLDAAAAATIIEGRLPADDYCRVRVRLRQTDDPGAAPADLADHSLRIAGTLDDGTPFVIRTASTPDIDVRSRSAPFTLDDASANLVLAFDVATWLDGVDIASGTPDPTGTIRIDEVDNDTLLIDFEDNLDQALDLFEDVDADGALGDDDVFLAGSD